MSVLQGAIIFGLLGLIFGSFVNALVWRLRQQLNDDGEPKKLSTKRKKELSVVSARSMCPNCKHVLGAKDLVPVFSWLFLRGRCHYCKKPISIQYPLVELLTAVLFGLSFYFWSFNDTWQYAAFATWLVCLVGLVALAVYDLKYMILPDKIIFRLYAIAGLGLTAQFILDRPISDIKQVLGAVLVAGGFFAVIYYVSKGRWIGGGDVKLGFLLGLLLPSATLAVLMMFLASLVATFVSLPLIASKKMKRSAKVPFGPFLIAGTVIAVLFGQNSIDWYLDFILYGS